VTDPLIELAERDPENFKRLLRDEPYRRPGTVAEARLRRDVAADGLDGDDAIEAEIRRLKKKLAERRRRRQVGAQRRARRESVLGRADAGTRGDVDFADAPVGEALDDDDLDETIRDERERLRTSRHERLVEAGFAKLWPEIEKRQGEPSAGAGDPANAAELQEGDRIDSGSIRESDRLDDRERTEFPTPEDWVRERALDWRTRHGREIAELRDLLEGSWPEFERERERKIAKVRERGRAMELPPTGEQALADEFDRGRALYGRAFAERLRERREGPYDGDDDGRLGKEAR
jgi:hypothetical protein